MNNQAMTAAVSTETIKSICDAVDSRGGILTKASALRHLTSILLSDFERQFDFGRPKSNAVDDVTVFTIQNEAYETMRWLLAEVWEHSQDLAKMVDDLQENLVEVSDAAYEVEKTISMNKAA